MDIDDLAVRVPSLPSMLLSVLALMYVYMINKELGLTEISSAQEKRHLAVEAFRKSHLGPVKVKVSVRSKAALASNTISISKKVAGRIKSLVEKGYKIDAVELTLPIADVARRNREPGHG